MQMNQLPSISVSPNLRVSVHYHYARGMRHTIVRGCTVHTPGSVTAFRLHWKAWYKVHALGRDGGEGRVAAYRLAASQRFHSELPPVAGNKPTDKGNDYHIPVQINVHGTQTYITIILQIQHDFWTKRRNKKVPDQLTQRMLIHLSPF